MVCVSVCSVLLCSVYHTECGGILAMGGRTEDSVGSQAGEHLLARGGINHPGLGIWSHCIWVVSATDLLLSALVTVYLKAC